jgi:hypothetical protein
MPLSLWRIPSTADKDRYEQGDLGGELPPPIARRRLGGCCGCRGVARIGFQQIGRTMLCHGRAAMPIVAVSQRPATSP